MAQFVCKLCGEGFEQKSRYERHMAASHPPRATSAADLEEALTGIEFPKPKPELLAYASQRLPPGSAVLDALAILPDRVYRDAAEVGVAFGEAMAPGRPRSAEDVAASEPPGRRGGRAAATEAVSAAAVAKMLGGIDFPKSKAELLAHAEHNHSRLADPEGILRVLQKLPQRRYTNMADVEMEVGKIL
ncbi:DUF2795 domain-containing protein [Sorangium sp. So ce1504]|uniref:DUF2795 domain-containing protein n=1 Tax=Sorangium sp. So ce1504 TaxID=3133337 RepID=UPI003F63A039